MTPEETRLAGELARVLSIHAPASVQVRFVVASDDPTNEGVVIQLSREGQRSLSMVVSWSALASGVAATIRSWGPELAQKLERFRGPDQP